MQLARIRFYQLRRDLGAWTFIIAAAAFFIVREIVSEKPQYSWFISIILIFAIQQHFLQRKDLSFARSLFQNAKWQMVLNYNITLLPCTLAFVITGNLLPAIVTHGIGSILPWVTFKLAGPRYLFLGRLVPSSQFEWITGLRKNAPLLLILCMLAIALSPVKLFGIAALFLLNLTFIGFYSISEPRIMLNPHNTTVAKFLNDKIRFVITVILVTNLPLLVVNCLFHQEVIFINAGFLLSFLLLAANSVLIKYSNYQPGESLSFSGDMLILLAAVFIPYLIPIAIMLYFVNHKKARLNLSQFTDDDQH